MKLIIEIPDKDYEFIKDLKTTILTRGNCKTIQSNVINSIKKSIPYKERSQLEHVIISNPKHGEFDGWMDQERMLLYGNPVTCELAIRFGWSWRKE